MYSVIKHGPQQSNSIFVHQERPYSALC